MSCGNGVLLTVGTRGQETRVEGSVCALRTRRACFTHGADEQPASRGRSEGQRQQQWTTHTQKHKDTKTRKTRKTQKKITDFVGLRSTTDSAFEGGSRRDVILYFCSVSWNYCTTTTVVTLLLLLVWCQISIGQSVDRPAVDTDKSPLACVLLFLPAG